MGGWRLGAAVGNANIIKTLLQVKSNVDSAHLPPSMMPVSLQFALLLVAGSMSETLFIDVGVIVLWKHFPGPSLTAQKPKGSLYIWARVEDGDGDAYVNHALEQAHVAFAPGSADGPGGKPYIRISSGISDKRLEEALIRLKIGTQTGYIKAKHRIVTHLYE